MPRGPDYQKERSERQQQRILDALQAGPMTTYQLAEILHLARPTVTKHINSLLVQPRRVHVESFILGNGRPRSVYAIGNGTNAKISRVQEGRILDFLAGQTEPLSTHQIAWLIGMTYPTARNYVRSLRERRKIHVAKWGWSDRTRRALYLAGKKDGAPKPASMPVRVKLARAPQAWFAALPGAQSIAQHQEAV